jgi:hypothetical protein
MTHWKIWRKVKDSQKTWDRKKVEAINNSRKNKRLQKTGLVITYYLAQNINTYH